MPASRVVYYVTADRLNGRAGPGTDRPIRENRKGQQIVRKKGDKITAAVIDGGWVKSISGTWYAKKYLSRSRPSGKVTSLVPGYRITTRWRQRPKDNTYWQARGYHDGVDFAAPIGAAVVAGNKGTVHYYNDSMLGTVILLYYRDRLLRKRTGWYCHLQRRSVPNGSKVVRGQKIGVVGATGRGARGSHLHYGVRGGHSAYWGGPDLDPTKDW